MNQEKAMSALPMLRAISAREALCELSTLADAADLIRDPSIRLQGLAGLLVAITAWGGGDRKVRASIEVCRRQLIASRRLRVELKPVLDDLLATPTLGLPARLARLNAAQRRQDPRWMIAQLLDLGLVDAARQAAEALPQWYGKPSALRTAAIRLARTGIQQTGTRRFVGSPLTAERFPASLPVFTRCARSLLGIHPSETVRAIALRILSQLSVADQQKGLVLWCQVRWQEAGEAAALEVLRQIRYRSRRSEAGLRLVEAALQTTDPEAAARFAVLIPSRRASDQAAEMLKTGTVTTRPVAPLISLSVRRVITQLHTDTPISEESQEEIRQWLRQPQALSELMQGMEGSGHPLAPQVRRLHAALSGGDRLWCALLMRRSMVLTSTMSTHQTAAAPPMPTTSEATSPERAAHDEWIALRPEGHARRRVLARACRAVLLSAARGETPTWRVRLRTLGHIGGDIALNVLTELLPRSAGDLRLAILRQLLRVSPAHLARTLEHSAESLPDAVMLEIIETLTLHRHLPGDTASGWRALCAETTSTWRAALLAAYREQVGGFPSPQLLRSTAEEVRQAPHVSGAELLRQAAEALAALQSATPTEIIDALLDSTLLRQRLRWARPASLPPRMAHWDDPRLLHALKLAASQGEVCDGVLNRTTQALTPEIRDALRQGRCPLPDLSVLTVNDTVQLRYLDKRMDLLTFFRFADPAACCWNSTGSHFGATQARLLAVWKDPLSFCFHINRIAGSGSPLGFVFGSLARCESGEPAVLLNGLYLRRQSRPLRDLTLSALERFFRHLGMRWLGVASRYAGCGAIPDRYQMTSKVIHRSRALMRDGKMVTDAIDDISVCINRTQPIRLYWMDLGTPVSPAGPTSL
ncbi:MAG: hypothetical protein ACI8RZ_000650 [Myxococcota bacterium]|jgi:hypothetical protein